MMLNNCHLLCKRFSISTEITSSQCFESRKSFSASKERFPLGEQRPARAHSPQCPSLAAPYIVKRNLLTSLLSSPLNSGSGSLFCMDGGRSWSIDSAKQAIVQRCNINFTPVQAILGCTQLGMSERDTVFWLNLMFWIEWG